jgi:alpha-L-fucosidase
MVSKEEKTMRTLSALVLALVLSVPLHAQETSDTRMAWWREARFGMFIHWGVYSVPAGTHDGQRVKGIGEWIMNKGNIPIPEYEAYARAFNPTKFDATEWVGIAADAGMKYIVITSKHHDGFCMWDSAVTDYDIVDFTPFKRDVLKELADACAARGVRLCFYHSIMDWHHPDAKGDRFSRYRDDYLIPQVQELLTGYGPIGVMWFDGEWIKEWTEPQGKALYNLLRDMRPELIINNRVGKGRKGMEGLNKDGDYAGDFGTPEQQVPAEGIPGVDWESCMTMNDTWGYKAYDHNWKSERQLLHTLIDITSKGGNFLLNVGPTSEGLIPEPSVERLAAMGRWMKIHGEAIYGTTASPYGRPAWGRFTAKPGYLYAHVFAWPESHRLAIPAPDLEVREARLLTADGPVLLEVAPGERGPVVLLPDAAPDPHASVVVLRHAGG